MMYGMHLESSAIKSSDRKMHLLFIRKTIYYYTLSVSGRVGQNV